MFNRTITTESLAAWLCWVAGALLAIGDGFGFLPDDAGFLGVVGMCFGHLISTHRMIAEMEARERQAFDLGREVGVRSIR